MKKKGLRTAPLGQVLSQIRRAEPVEPTQEYKLLGAHWYAKGLYVKEVKPGSQIRAKKLYRVEEGDFVYNRLFAWKGSFAVVSPDDHGCYVSNEFPCFIVNREVLDPKYLWWYFSRESKWMEALGLSSGGTPTSRNRLKEAKLLSMGISFPSLLEQQRIVARIESLKANIDEAYGLRQQTVQDAEVLLKAASREVFGDGISDDWVQLSSYVSEIENGWSPACENRPREGDEWGVLKVGCISFGYYNPAENKALPNSLDPRPKHEVKVGDFLMCRANTKELVGGCGIVDETPPRLMLSDKIFRFVFREDAVIDKEYLDYGLKSQVLREQIELCASGTSPTMKNISKSKVMSLRLPPHEPDEQRQIVAYLDDLHMKMNTLRYLQAKTATELDALLPSILEKAFDGRM